MAKRSSAALPGKRIDVEYVAPSTLRPASYNPRSSNEATERNLERSIQEHGFVDPVIARPDGEVIGGHLRLEIAKRLGLPEIPVVFVDLDDEQVRLLNLALNRISGDWDVEKLGALFLELANVPDIDFAASGFDLPEIARAVTSYLGARTGLVPYDDAPSLPKAPVTRPGDRYRLGDHVIICADARDAMAAPRHSVDVLWSDPPYGVGYAGGTKEALTITGDHSSEIAELLRAAFSTANEQLKPGARIYICHPAGPLSVLFGQQFLDAGWRLHQTLIWVKDSLVLGRSDYHYRHEPILYGYVPGKRTGRGRGSWYGDHRQNSVFEVPRPKASPDHPTMKPVRLIEAHLINSSKPGDLVLDPFLGSGSTLIACEKLGRRCVGLRDRSAIRRCLRSPMGGVHWRQGRARWIATMTDSTIRLARRAAPRLGGRAALTTSLIRSWQRCATVPIAPPPLSTQASNTAPSARG